MSDLVIPEEFDTAIYTQGYEDGLREVKTTVVQTSPFVAGTHQDLSWQAGYAVGNPPPPPPGRASKSRNDED